MDERQRRFRYPGRHEWLSPFDRSVVGRGEGMGCVSGDDVRKVLQNTKLRQGNLGYIYRRGVLLLDKGKGKL